MADYTLSVPLFLGTAMFPSGTTVYANPLRRAGGDEPVSATSDGSTVSFSGLRSFEDYVAFAVIDGVRREARFETGTDTGEAQGGSGLPPAQSGDEGRFLRRRGENQFGGEWSGIALVDVGGIDGLLGVIFHGDDANHPRSVNVEHVLWVGTVLPTLLVPGDIYFPSDAIPAATALLASANTWAEVQSMAKGSLLTEIADPSAPAANTARFYARDNGSGKTQLVARFPSGAVQIIATEP